MVRTLGLLSGPSSVKDVAPLSQDFSTFLSDPMSHSKRGSFLQPQLLNYASDLFPDGQWGEAQNSCSLSEEARVLVHQWPRLPWG